MTRSQRIGRQVDIIGDNFKYISYHYLYVEDGQKEKSERIIGDLKGYHPIGEAVYENTKSNGKVIGWVWKRMYQKDTK